MQYQERINISQQPQGEVINTEKTTINVDRGDINTEKTAINDRGDYAYRGAINNKRLRRQRSHQRQKTVSACHVSLNIGTVILVL